MQQASGKSTGARIGGAIWGAIWGLIFGLGAALFLSQTGTTLVDMHSRSSLLIPAIMTIAGLLIGAFGGRARRV